MGVDFLLQQKRYNEAFDIWEHKGYDINCSEYKVIFDCIYQACRNKAKAMLKQKVFINDIEDKALDCTILIMQRHEIGRHVKIGSLGAYVEGPLMNFIWGKKAKENDRKSAERQKNNEELQRKLEYEFAAIDGNALTDSKEKAIYLVDGKSYTIDTTEIFLKIWNTEVKHEIRFATRRRSARKEKQSCFQHPNTQKFSQLTLFELA